MPLYFETLQELGRWSSANRVTVDPGVDLHSFSAMNEAGGRYFEQQPALRRVVGFIARQLGSVNLNLYRWDDKGGREREYPNTHPAARFLENPAGAELGEATTPMDLKESLLIDGLIHDKFFALLQYDERTGLPTGMRRLPASRVSVKGAAGRVTGVTYHREDGENVEMDTKYLFYRVGYTPHTGAGGSSPLKALRELLDGSSSALQFRRELLRNAANIPGVLETDSALTDAVYTRIRSSWDSHSSGGALAGREPILEQGLKYKQLQPMKGVDVLDLDGRKLADEEVATMYWIYPELLGLREGTNSNMDSLKQALWSICLGPYLTQWQQSWDLMIKQQFRIQGRYVDADISGRMRGSFAEEAEWMSKSVGGPYKTVAEARRDQNLPYIEGTDKLIVPMNVTKGGKASPMDGE